METNQAQQEYWAVRCTTCGEMIPIARLWRKRDNAKEFLDVLADPPVFTATCEAGHESSFIKDEMFAWFGPASLGFRDHPAIKFPTLKAR